ncbi:MAG: DUF4382 domain-containing protein [Chloroflexi bacterium]|nr:DUF4382 domain-containing protein [Chloroflexota bacterium]
MTTFDLLKIKGLEEVLAADNITAGKYTQVRLVIDKVEVGLDNGPAEAATLPSNELKFVHPFEIEAGKTTILLLDFDAEKSVGFQLGRDALVDWFTVALALGTLLVLLRLRVNSAWLVLAGGLVGVAYATFTG